MIKIFKIKTPKHTMGRSYRFDFPISGSERFVTGAFAWVSNVDADFPNGSTQSSQPNVFTLPCQFGKVSIATDGCVVVPSCPLFTPDRFSFQLSKAMQAVDFQKLGNKLSVIIEEIPIEWDFPVAYEAKIYLKTVKDSQIRKFHKVC